MIAAGSDKIYDQRARLRSCSDTVEELLHPLRQLPKCRLLQWQMSPVAQFDERLSGVDSLEDVAAERGWSPAVRARMNH